VGCDPLQLLALVTAGSNPSLSSPLGASSKPKLSYMQHSSLAFLVLGLARGIRNNSIPALSQGIPVRDGYKGPLQPVCPSKGGSSTVGLIMHPAANKPSCQTPAETPFTVTPLVSAVPGASALPAGFAPPGFTPLTQRQFGKQHRCQLRPHQQPSSCPPAAHLAA